jgi:hypothetical protein
MGGISEIENNEAHRKRLKRLESLKNSMSSLFGPEVYEFTEEDVIEAVNLLKEKFIKTGQVPQIVGIEDFKLLF